MDTNRHWVMATNNQKKLQEFQLLLKKFHDDITVSTMADHQLESPLENGLTFIENALIKAREVSFRTGLASLADDSGLVVPALQGAPGLYSARYAFDGATDEQNNVALAAALVELGVESTPAYYHCTLAFLRHGKDPDPIIAQGHWFGKIQIESRGNQGFGYDPMFYPGPNYECSAAQMMPEQKARESHRGIAVRQFFMAIDQARQCGSI